MTVLAIRLLQHLIKWPDMVVVVAVNLMPVRPADGDDTACHPTTCAPYLLYIHTVGTGYLVSIISLTHRYRCQPCDK